MNVSDNKFHLPINNITCIAVKKKKQYYVHKIRECTHNLRKRFLFLILKSHNVSNNLNLEIFIIFKFKTIFKLSVEPSQYE